MKNKWLKTLTCFASVFAIGSTIAISSTSCGCSTVEKINPLPENVYDIDKTTHELKGFKSDFLNNPDSEIYQNNFKDCDSMEIPASVTNINANAFWNFETLNTTIPSFIKNLTFAKNSNCSSIGNSAFAYSVLNSVDFSNANSLEKIEDSAFYMCSSLVSVDLTNCTNLSSIGDWAFDTCTSLTSITFPSSLREIGEYAFSDCSKLNDIKWDLPEKYKTDITINPAAFNSIS